MPKPSDFFPWQGIITNIIEKLNESGNKDDKISEIEVNNIKNFYNKSVIKFFELLNLKTTKIIKFVPEEVEQIFSEVIKQLIIELKSDEKYLSIDIVKSIEIGMPKITKYFLSDNYWIRGTVGINFYATYKKNKNKLKPLLDLYYKGPPLPTEPPFYSNMKKIKCPPKHKLFDGKCSRVKCPNGFKMIGSSSNINGNTVDCYNKKNDMNLFNLNVDYLEMDLTKPILHECAYNQIYKNKKCVFVMCPKGYTNDSIEFNNNEYTHFCRNKKTGHLKKILNEKLPSAVCLTYNMTGECIELGHLPEN
jgi:hypothetical protein